MIKLESEMTPINKSKYSKRNQTATSIVLTGSLIFCIFCIFCSFACAETVIVGGYPFPPFVESTDGMFEGLTLDLIKEFNKFQKQYRFSFHPTSPKRRYSDFDKGMFDMLFFESIQWGWQEKDITASRVFLKGGEVYITRASPEKDQRYFESFTGKSLIGYLGYHYGFANFNSDETNLRKNFDITLSNSHKRNIQMILKKRIDIGIVTISYLNRYLMNHPENKNQLLISSKLDQVYHHTILIRKNNTPDVHEINRLLDEMKKAHVLSDLFRKYGLNAANP